MSRKRKIFGPMLFGTLALAFVVLVGLGLWNLWPRWRQYREMRALAGELRSPDVLVSWQAADQLARAGAAGIPWLVEAMRNRDPGVRLLAVSALGRTMPLPREAIPALVVCLRDTEVRVRRQAADALGRFGPEAAAATDDLTRALRDRDLIVRFRAARALARIGGAAVEPARRALLDLLADPVINQIPNLTVVVPVIRRLGPKAEAEAIATLIPLIDARDPLIRRTAIEYLEEFGPSARVAIPALKRALHDQDLLARCLAASALSEIEGWEHGRARALLQELEDQQVVPPSMRKQVHWVLATNLVAGSEIYQPVHILRSLIDDLWSQEGRLQTRRLGYGEEWLGPVSPWAKIRHENAGMASLARLIQTSEAGRRDRSSGTSVPVAATPPQSKPEAHIQDPAAPH